MPRSGPHHVGAEQEVSTDVNVGEKPRLISERKLGQFVAEARVARGLDPAPTRGDRQERGASGPDGSLETNAGLPGGDSERGRAGVAPPVHDPALFDPVEFPTIEVPLSKITLSKEVENFKKGADPITGDVLGQEFRGKYQRLRTGSILLWERKCGGLAVASSPHQTHRGMAGSAAPARVDPAARSWARTAARRRGRGKATAFEGLAVRGLTAAPDKPRQRTHPGRQPAMRHSSRRPSSA